MRTGIFVRLMGKAELRPKGWEEGSQGFGNPGRGLSAYEGSEMEDSSGCSRRTERHLVLEGGEQVECDLG